jgi:hypothetical protein
MPATPVRLPWREGAAEVDAAGRITLAVPGLPPVRLAAAGAGLDGARLVLAEDDLAEHEGRAGELGVGQRVTVGEHCQVRWRVDVPAGAEPAALEVAVDLGGAVGWLWPAGADGWLAVSPARGNSPTLLLQAWRAELRRSAAVGDGLRLVVTPRGLGAGRHEVVLRALVIEPPSSVGTALPGWYEPLVLEAGDHWTGAIADFGLDHADALTVATAEEGSLVRLGGPPGRHRFALHGPQGVTDLVLEVAPAPGDVLRQVAVGLDPAALVAAGAFVLHRALASGALERTPGREDALDRFDWTRRPGLLAIALGAERALAEGEREMACEAVRRLAAEPATLGHARVATLVGLAAGALGVAEAPSPPAVGEGLAALEVALVLDADGPAVEAEVDGVINRLGGTLPGEPVDLDRCQQALLAGLLELVPEYWGVAWEAGATAQVTRRRILAAYAAGELVDPEPLAWLLVTG